MNDDELAGLTTLFSGMLGKDAERCLCGRVGTLRCTYCESVFCGPCTDGHTCPPGVKEAYDRGYQDRQILLDIDRSVAANRLPAG